MNDAELDVKAQGIIGSSVPLVLAPKMGRGLVPVPKNEATATHIKKRDIKEKSEEGDLALRAPLVI